MYTYSIHIRLDIVSQSSRIQKLIQLVLVRHQVSVGIRSFSAKQPPFVLRDADYAVAWLKNFCGSVLQRVSTQVYVVSQRFPSSTPLVFRGPGAGAEFTASGLLVGLSVGGLGFCSKALR